VRELKFGKIITIFVAILVIILLAFLSNLFMKTSNNGLDSIDSDILSVVVSDDVDDLTSERITESYIDNVEICNNLNDNLSIACKERLAWAITGSAMSEGSPLAINLNESNSFQVLSKTVVTFDMCNSFYVKNITSMYDARFFTAPYVELDEVFAGVKKEFALYFMLAISGSNQGWCNCITDFLDIDINSDIPEYWSCLRASHDVQDLWIYSVRNTNYNLNESIKKCDDMISIFNITKSDPYYKNCIYVSGIRLNNPDVCLVYDTPDVIEDCAISILKHLKVPGESCESTSNTMWKAKCYESKKSSTIEYTDGVPTLFNDAELTEDLCKSISAIDSVQTCYKELAIKLNDSYYCSKLISPYDVGSCYGSTGTLEDCNSLVNINAYESCIDLNNIN